MSPVMSRIVSLGAEIDSVEDFQDGHAAEGVGVVAGCLGLREALWQREQTSGEVADALGHPGQWPWETMSVHVRWTTLSPAIFSFTGLGSDPAEEGLPALTATAKNPAEISRRF